MNCNQIKIFINLEIIGEENKDKIYIYIYIYIVGSLFSDWAPKNRWIQVQRTRYNEFVESESIGWALTRQ